MSRHRQRGVRPVLLLIVYGTFLMVVGITATVQTILVSIHFSTAVLTTAVAADGAIVRTFANEQLQAADLANGGDPTRRATLEATLTRLAGAAGADAIVVRDPAGGVLFAPGAGPGAVPAAGADVDAAFRRAAHGETGASVVGAGDPTGWIGLPRADHDLLREDLPLLDAAGEPRAVVQLWRDARPVLAPLGGVQAQMLLVTLAAASIAALMLFLVFRAAQDRIRQQTALLLESTRRDPLTGMLNHGALVAELAEVLEHARANGAPVGVALVDLDNFRLLNDVHGHEAGDAALVRLARTVEAHLPADTRAGRYGPDEFLLIAQPGSIADLEPALDRLRHALVDEALQFGESERLPVTISAGIAAYPADAESVTELLSAVTLVLGEARASGGDAVRVANRAAAPTEDARAFNVLQGLVFTIDTKDRYTKRHSEDVARYGVFLAQRLGLDPAFIDAIRVAGLLHDVGKVGIPEAILRKPARLTTAEYDVVKQHVALGDAIVRDLVRHEIVRAGIRHHHERWDGRGYLDELAGETIPLAARILAVADAFSAMTTTRPYRKAMSIEEALARLTDAASSQLDERLVVAFVEGIGQAADAPLPGEAAAIPLWLPATRVA